MLKRDGNDCLTRCVAWILKLDHKRVPFFIGNKNWFNYLNRWLGKKGYKAIFKYNIGKQAKRFLSLKKPIIAVGVSLRSKCQGSTKNGEYDRRATLHAVIMAHGKFIFNPSGNQEFMKGKPVYYLNIIKIKSYAEKQKNCSRNTTGKKS